MSNEGACRGRMSRVLGTFIKVRVHANVDTPLRTPTRLGCRGYVFPMAYTNTTGPPYNSLWGFSSHSTVLLSDHCRAANFGWHMLYKTYMLTGLANYG